MPTLAVDNFNIVCATLGGFIGAFGLISYLLKEKFYLSEALISTLAGVIFSPHATNFIKPLQFANDNALDLEFITLYFTRLVLGVQLVLAGVQLPSKYLRTEWKSLSILLGPGMCMMWMVTSLLVWGLVPNLPILSALAVGACVTPTDPVLSNSILKGKFADKNIPPPLQKVIIAESGANDGLGYPFLFLALYLLKYTHNGGLGQSGGAREAMGLWFGETWGYTILLSIVYGAVVGWIAKDLLHWAEDRRYVDRESFLVFAITLALFIVGTVGMIGSDDVLACFVAGNAFTWDDWFRLETMDDSLQPTIDMLLNVAIFMWFGAVCPWHQFLANDVIPIYRLIPLGILVLLLRRLPMVLLFHKKIHQIEDIRRASFTGFFGPIGVSAVFYIYISREFLRGITVDGQQRSDAAQLSDAINVVVWFLAICSVFVHGLCIPLTKLGIYLPRTLSTAISSERVSRTVSQARDERYLRTRSRSRQPGTSEKLPPPAAFIPGRPLFGVLNKFSKKVVQDIRGRTSSIIGRADDQDGRAQGTSSQKANRSQRPSVSMPMDGRIIGRPINAPNAQAYVANGPIKDSENGSEMLRSDGDIARPQRSMLRSGASSRTSSPGHHAPTTGDPAPVWQRQIRFPNETFSAPGTIAKPENRM